MENSDTSKDPSTVSPRENPKEEESWLVTALWLLLLGWFAFAFIFYTALLATAWEADAKRICEGMGVPYEIVQAIVHVESGGDPYVLNVAIGSAWKAYRFDDAESATVFLNAALQHTDRIDIGLMQVHWRVWKKHYGVRATALLDVSTNLTIGCDIVQRELAGDGPLWQRIGRYHSRTPALNEGYSLRVLKEAVNEK